MSLQQLLGAGVAPKEKKAIVVKGVIAPRAAYEPVCSEILTVDTPGVTTGDPARFSYRYRRKQMYPLEEHAAYTTSQLHGVQGSGRYTHPETPRSRPCKASGSGPRPVAESERYDVRMVDEA